MNKIIDILQNTLASQEYLSKLEGYYSSLDDYSNELVVLEGKKIKPEYRGSKEFKGCSNYNIISEASLNRLLQHVNDNEKVWAIITAHRAGLPKEENILRNRALRGQLNSRKMGVYQLIGHWKDTIERSYFTIKPDELSETEFIEFIKSLMTIDGLVQEAVLIGHGTRVQLMDFDGEIELVGNKITLNKMGQAYSRHIKKQNSPFVFEGMEIPGSISGCRVFHDEGVQYIRP